MAVKYEWKVTKAGRRYVRTVVPDEPSPVSAPVEVPATAVEVGEYVPEIVIEPVEDEPKPKRGRPKKVVTEAEADE